MALVVKQNETSMIINTFHPFDEFFLFYANKKLRLGKLVSDFRVYSELLYGDSFSKGAKGGVDQNSSFRTSTALATICNFFNGDQGRLYENRVAQKVFRSLQLMSMIIDTIYPSNDFVDSAIQKHLPPLQRTLLA